MIQTIGNEGVKEVTMHETKMDDDKAVIKVNGEGMTVKDGKVVNLNGIEKSRGIMEVKDGLVAQVSSVNALSEVGMIGIEWEGMKDEEVESRGEIEVNEVALEKLDGGKVKQTKEMVVVEEVVEVVNDDVSAKSVDLKREGIKRLAEMERLAENERQAKIRKREELDRVARLQRVLALVGAPELDSVAKIKEGGDLRQPKEMERGKDISVLKELDVLTNKDPKIDPLDVKEKELVKMESLVDKAPLTNKKQIPLYEGIAKLERMSKEERILEIDRLVNLELEAEAKRKADIEKAKKLEREAEIERLAKMKLLLELDLKAELERGEKGRLAEKERHEKITRKEELDRVAKLQRVLVMLRASESDRIAELKQAELERSSEAKRKKDMEVLEELGILTNERNLESEKVANVKHMDGASLTLEIKSEKNVNSVKKVIAKETAKVNAVVTPFPNVEQSANNEIKSNNAITKDTENSAIINHAAEVEDHSKRNAEIKRKRREELDRVGKLHPIVAMASNSNPESDHVEKVKQANETELSAEMKRRDDMKILEELGIVSKKEVQKENNTVQPVGEIKILAGESHDMEAKIAIEEMLIPETKTLAKENALEIDIPNEKPMAQKERNIQMKIVDSEKETKIILTAEMEHKAKADREARRKHRDEMNRIANLQRIVALVPNEEFNSITAIKQAELEINAANKRKEDMNVLELLGIVSKEEDVKTDIESKFKVDTKNNLSKMENVTDVDEIELQSEINLAKIETIPKRIKDMEPLVKQGVERRLAELRVSQMRRVAELGREMKEAILDEHSSQNQEKSKHIESERVQMEATDIGRVKEKLEFKLREEISDLEVESALNMREEDSKRMADLGSPEQKQNMADTIRVDTKFMDELNKFSNLRFPGVKQGAVAEDVKSEEELKSVSVKSERELKRIIEMKNVLGIERVNIRGCEWDGQMMYVTRESL